MRSTDWLARRRVPIGFLVGTAAMLLARPTWRTFALGGGLAVLGEGVRVWAAGHLEKGREVTCSGPYRWVRHPLYLGSALMGAGFAIAAAQPLVAALAVLYLAVTLGAAMSVEDQWLRARFGADYDAYRAGQLVGGQRRFSMARAIGNREHRTMAGLVIVMLMLAWKVSG